MGEVPFTDVVIHSTVHAPTGRPDVEEPRHRHEPARGDRGVRRGRDALRPPEDGLVAGRPLLGGRDRGGTQARDEALERRAAVPPARRRGRARTSGRPRSRSAGSLRGSSRRGQASRTHGGGSTSRTLSTALYHLTFDDFCDWYAEAIKPRLYAEDEAARATALQPSSSCSAPPSGHAARHGGDLVAVPRERA